MIRGVGGNSENRSDSGEGKGGQKRTNIMQQVKRYMLTEGFKPTIPHAREAIMHP